MIVAYSSVRGQEESVYYLVLAWRQVVSTVPTPYSLFLRLDEAFLDCEEDQLRRAVEIESLHHVRAVYGYRIDADIKQRSNFLVGFSLSN